MTPARTPSIHAVLAGRRVLVVDDDVQIRKGMQAVLSRHGLNVDVAAGAGEAYAIACKHKPDALLTDYYLQCGNKDTGNGVDLAMRLRMSVNAALPVLIVTGDPAVGQLPQVQQKNFTVLYKPVKVEKMLHALREALASRVHPMGS